jgi:hypothetical protein
MTCPTGFTAQQVNIHQRDPEATITVWVCIQN